MIPTHTACGATIGFRLVLADDGDPAIVRWCPACDVALCDVECTPPDELLIEDVPLTLRHQLLAMRDRNTPQ